MEFRYAADPDFERVTAFYRDAIARTPDMGIYAHWSYGLHPTDAMLRDYIRRGELILLEDGGVIRGAMALTLYQSEEYHAVGWGVDAADDEAAVVHILCIYPDCQRAGIGKRMIREAIRIARAEKKKAVRLDALESNTPAHGLYRALGFAYQGTQRLYADNTGWTNFLYFEYCLEA